MSAPACSSSSLGNDSDEGSPGKEAEAGDGEVQSTYNGAGLAAGLGALEESLPIRRGISRFYNGKSKSFTFLREALTPSGSSRVIAKADNAYTRKRKNLLAYSIIYASNIDEVPVQEPEPTAQIYDVVEISDQQEGQYWQEDAAEEDAPEDPIYFEEDWA